MNGGADPGTSVLGNAFLKAANDGNARATPRDKKFGVCYIEHFRGCCVTVRRPMSQMDAQSRRRLSWQAAVVVVGLTLTLSWAVFLAYEFIRLVAYAI